MNHTAELCRFSRDHVICHYREYCIAFCSVVQWVRSKYNYYGEKAAAVWGTHCQLKVCKPHSKWLTEALTALSFQSIIIKVISRVSAYSSKIIQGWAKPLHVTIATFSR